MLRQPFCVHAGHEAAVLGAELLLPGVLTLGFGSVGILAGWRHAPTGAALAKPTRQKPACAQHPFGQVLTLPEIREWTHDERNSLIKANIRQLERDRS